METVNVAVDVEVAVFSVNRNARIVTDALMCIAGNVEERGFAAVRIADENDAQLFAFLLGNMMNEVYVLSRQAWQIGLRFAPCLSFFLCDAFHHSCLGTTQADLVVHQFVFHGIVERSIQHSFDGCALDEAHLYNAFPESSVSVNLNDYATFACVEF